MEPDSRQSMTAAFRGNLKRFSSPLWRFFQIVRLYYPLTAAGTVLLATAFIMFVAGISDRNAYATLLSFTAFFLLSVFSIAGRLQASRLAGQEPTWDPGTAVYAERFGLEQKFSFPGTKILPFFRMNILIKGPFVAGRNVVFKFRREVSVHDGSSAGIPMYFPLSGILHGRTITRVRDIFGLTSSRFGTDTVRQLIVQPVPLLEVLQETIHAAGGFEEKSRRKSADDEKFYMREYIPGDRLRDINWKSSSRLSQLITRISPNAQEKTRVVQIVVRNFSRDAADTIESTAHLHFLKSWLIAFIRNIRKNHPEYRFNVFHGAGSSTLLESDEDIELFSLDLGRLSFTQDPGISFEIPFTEGYLFTTAFDVMLPQFLSAHDGVHFSVYRTIPSVRKKDDTAITLHLLPINGFVPVPDLRTFFSGIRRLKEWNRNVPRCTMTEQSLRVELF